MNYFKNIIANRKIILLVGDIVICFIAFNLAFVSRFYLYSNATEILKYYPSLTKEMFFVFIVIFISLLQETYVFNTFKNRKNIFFNIITNGAFSFIGLAAIYYFVPYFEVGRGILLLALFFVAVSRFIWYQICDISYKKIPSVKKGVLVLGTGSLAKKLGRLIDDKKNGLKLVGYVNFLNEPITVPDEKIIDYNNGNGTSLLEIAKREKVQKIIVSLAERRGNLPVREILACKLSGIDVVDAPSFYEYISGKLLIEDVNPSWFIFSDGFRETIYTKHFKRMLDIIIGFFGCIIFLPAFFLIPVFIKLDSKGPALLKQQRMGEGEKVFTLYKFRTMIENAEKESGPVWSQGKDSRITRIGKCLRKHRLDEIPQLLNVINGSMSFIGPRPERQFFIESLKKQIPYYIERLYVKPGLTGWAQIKYKYGDSVEDAIEKLKYDLFYIKRLSFKLDLLVLFYSLKIVLGGNGR